MLPRMYLLDTDYNPWRTEAVQKRFAEQGLDVERFCGVYGQTIGVMPTQTVFDTHRDNTYRNNPGKLSITISKLLLWQHILDSGVDECIIFENDVTFCDNFVGEFATSYQALPEDWQVAHIGHCCTEGKPTKVINDRISQVRYPLCCHAMLWKREGLAAAYHAMKRASWGSNSDIILERAIYPKLNHYTFTPALAFQDQTPSEAAKTEVYTDVQGWFTPCMQQIYHEQLDSFGYDPAVVVEVGSWLGRSTIWMADEIKRRLKPVTFYAVDTWQGSANEPDMKPTLDAYNGDIYDQFIRNICRCGVYDYIKPIRMPSVEAAKQFADGSVNFCFIDGDHSYEAVKADIQAWLPKVHFNSCIAGHDLDRPGVRRAVDEMFPGKWRRYEQCWIVDNCHR